MFGRIVLKQLSTQGKPVNENLGYINYSIMNSDTPTLTKNVSVNNFINGISSLTTNTKVVGNVVYEENIEDYISP